MDMSKMDALDAVVSEVDAQGGPTPEQQAEQQQQQTMQDGAREWGMIMFMIGGGLAMIAPELRKVYTEEACAAWGASVMPVSEKYGWDGPGSIPEVGLAISTIGLAVPSVLAIRAKLAELKEARLDAERLERAAKPADPIAGLGTAPADLGAPRDGS